MKAFFALLMTLLLVFGAAACTAAPAGNATSPASASATPSPAPTAGPTEAAATEQPDDTETTDYGQLGNELMNGESIGAVKLRMTESEVLAALGQPDSESEAQVWGADGKKHMDWVYEGKGLTVNMAESDNPESEFVSFSITAEAPCDLATQKGVKIGDKRDTVLAAYGDAVENRDEEDTKDSIVAGTVYGGMIFGMKDGAVTTIFIGASAE